MTIKVSLTDGLGNQLFQYAAGLALSKYHGVPLWLDTSFFAEGEHYKLGKTRRAYELHHFSILAKKTGVMKPQGGDELIHEPRAYFFYKDFFSSPRNSFLKGYWQCYGYLADIGKELLASMTPRKKMPAEGARWLGVVQGMKGDMKSGQAVFIHVRRQDYVKVGVALPVDYYRAAIAEVAKHVAKPCFFVFADDMDWARKNLPLKKHEVRYVTTGAAWQDITIMSHCHHAIIANSSFSWWGAYLLWLRRNKDSQTMVIMPDIKNWANQTISAESFFLPAWRQIKIKRTIFRFVMDKFIGKWHYKLLEKIKLLSRKRFDTKSTAKKIARIKKP
ncbi:MAG: alpha-1,2-fucosyltransferase [Hydrotalea sp.]|nr:alpha-1,2-fucosyltransferase [Hydrotalea sp.]